MRSAVGKTRDTPGLVFVTKGFFLSFWPHLLPNNDFSIVSSCFNSGCCKYGRVKGSGELTFEILSSKMSSLVACSTGLVKNVEILPPWQVLSNRFLRHFLSLSDPLTSPLSSRFWINFRAAVEDEYNTGSVYVIISVHDRHGPKPGRHEAFSMLEAQALTHFSLEAQALVTKPKPKPGYLYSTNVSWIQLW